MLWAMVENGLVGLGWGLIAQQHEKPLLVLWGGLIGDAVRLSAFASSMGVNRVA